jgi:hypothetical protein
MAEAANPETRLATRPISNLKPAHRPLALPGSLIRTVALRCPAVVGRVPARLVPAVHASWPLAAPRFDRSSKLPSLHCDHPRCRRWLVGCHRGGLLLLAHVRSCCFAFAATWAPAGERTGASIRLRHVGLRCCGRRGRRQARWPFLSELGPIPLWPLGLAADSSPAAPGGERRPRTPARDDGDGWGRAGGKVGGGYSSPPRRQPAAPPRLPGRSSRTSTSFARCRAQRPLHTAARSAYPAAGCSSPRASRLCAVGASPDSRRASCAMELIPTSVKAILHACRFEFMPIRPILAGTNASNLTARGVSRSIGANKPAYKQTEVEKARSTLTGIGVDLEHAARTRPHRHAEHQAMQSRGGKARSF